MTIWPQRLSNRLLLTTMLGLLLLSLLTITMSMREQQEVLQTEAEQRLLQVTDAYRNALAFMLHTRAEALSELKQNLEGWYDPEHPELVDEAGLKALFDSLWVVNAQGEIVDDWTSDGSSPPQTSIGDTELFAAVQRTDDLYVSEPRLRTYAGERPVIHFAYPLRAEGEFIGAVVGNFQVLDNILLRAVGLAEIGHGGYLAVAAGDGTVIAHPREQLLMTQATKVDNELFQQAIAGWEGAGLAENITGEPAIQSFLRLPQTGWVVGAVMPLAEALQPAHDLARVQIWVIGLGSALILILTGLVLRSVLSPLRRLDTEIAAIRHGQLKQLHLPKVGELRRLARHFNLLLKQNLQQRHKLSERQAYLDEILRTSPVGLYMTDGQGQLEYLNDTMTDITGFAPRELKGGALLKHIPVEQRNKVREYWRESLQREQSSEIEFPYRHQQGHLVQLRLETHPVMSDGKCVGHVGSLADITEQHETIRSLEGQANTDHLTALLNRRGFQAALEACWIKQAELAVLAVDLDNFKGVNDQGGHELGDQLLQQVARILTHHTRQSDLTGRYGGDEFLVALPGCPLTKAAEIAEQIRVDIAAVGTELRASVPGLEVNLTASIGVVQRTGSEQSAMDLLRRADEAAYAAKHAGRNQVMITPE